MYVDSWCHERERERERGRERAIKTKGTKLIKLRHEQLFSNLVDHCFMSCVDDFTSKSLSTRETGCITRCVQKQMALSQRLSERFAEHNAAMGAQPPK